MSVRIFLFASGVMFLGFGTWSLLDPLGMTSSIGVSPGGPNGVFETRGIYGGVSLAISVFAIVGAVMNSYARPALWLIAVYMGGYVFARLAGLALGDRPTADFLGLALFELVTLALSGACLHLHGKKA